MKQSALDWLKKELETYGSPSNLKLDWLTLDELLEQAKEMEKEQIIKAYQQGVTEEYGDTLDFSNNKDAEDYYKRIFSD